MALLVKSFDKEFRSEPKRIEKKTHIKWWLSESFSQTFNPYITFKGQNFQWNHEISMIQEIHISELELQRWSLEFVISFSKVNIWD
jgi:hypothetical protein